MIDPLALSKPGASQFPAGPADPQSEPAQKPSSGGSRFGDVLQMIPRRPELAAAFATGTAGEGEAVETPDQIDAVSAHSQPGTQETAPDDLPGAPPAPAPDDPEATGLRDRATAPDRVTAHSTDALPGDRPIAPSPSQTSQGQLPEANMKSADRPDPPQAVASDAPAKATTPPRASLAEATAPNPIPWHDAEDADDTPNRAEPPARATGPSALNTANVSGPDTQRTAPMRQDSPVPAAPVTTGQTPLLSADQRSAAIPPQELAPRVMSTGAGATPSVARLANPATGDAEPPGSSARDKPRIEGERFGILTQADRSGRTAAPLPVADKPIMPVAPPASGALAPLDPLAEPVPASLGAETGRFRTTDIQRASGPSVTTAPALDRAMIVHIAQTSPQPGRPAIEITLSPEELGRVRLSLTSTDGILTVSLTTERPETMDLMRRHASELAQEYRALGYEGVEFQFQQQRQHSETFGSGDAPDLTGLPPMTEDEVVETHAMTLSRTGVDIRI